MHLLRRRSHGKAESRQLPVGQLGHVVSSAAAFHLGLHHVQKHHLPIKRGHLPENAK